MIQIILATTKGGAGGRILDGKLDTYFSVKCDFFKEPYLKLRKFSLEESDL